MNSNWHEVSDDRITASQQELDTYWKIVSLKNAAAMGLSSKRITAVDPRCDKNIVNEIIGILDSPCWYQRISNPESGWTQISGDKSDKNNLLCFKGNASVTFESVYNDEDDNMSYLSCRIMYMFNSEHDNIEKSRKLIERYSWINDIDYKDLSEITGYMVWDVEGVPESIDITVDGMIMTVENKDGKCHLKETVDAGDKIINTAK